MGILVTSSCPENTYEDLGIKNWPIWDCDVSYFDWTYEDKEIPLLLLGEVTVTPDRAEPVKCCEGNLVIFPARMKCL